MPPVSRNTPISLCQAVNVWAAKSVLSLSWEHMFIFIVSLNIEAYCLEAAVGKPAHSSGGALGNALEDIRIPLLYFPCCKVRQLRRNSYPNTQVVRNGESGVKAKRI